MRYIVLTLAMITLGLSGEATGQQARLPGFGPPENGASLPGFGSATKPKPTLSREDWAYSGMQFDRLDKNKDAKISRAELRGTRYQSYEARWFTFDADRNDRLSPRELADFYARARVDQARKLQETARAKRRASGAKVTSDDSANARTQIAQLDLNRDRKLDRSEAAAAWGKAARQIFSDHDLNRSGYLTSNELAGHYATARVNQQKEQGQGQVLWKLSQSTLRLPQANVEFLQAARDFEIQLQFLNPESVAGPTQAMINRYDVNGDGILQRAEWQQIEGQLGRVDADRDGSLTPEELGTWLARGKSPSKRSKSPRTWFAERDVNLDGQVSMSEYASQWTEPLLEEFARLDDNQDGLISVAESLSSSNRHEREFASDRSAVIESGVGARSSIQVDEAFEIADINVQLSISHAAPTQLDAFLVAPSGKRVELFTGADKEWEGANFDETLFDDEAASSIAQASPPFRGTLSPEGAATAGKQGLSGIYGEPSEGVWRLFVPATRSDRAGLLHGWSLLLVPKPGS